LWQEQDRGRSRGTGIDEDLADLEVSGGSYPDGRESTYLTWVSALSLQPGQVITVLLLENAPTSHLGKTIAELFPDEEPSATTDFKPTPEIIAEIRSRSFVTSSRFVLRHRRAQLMSERLIQTHMGLGLRLTGPRLILNARGYRFTRTPLKTLNTRDR
jgi:hypothetical protein